MSDDNAKWLEALIVHAEMVHGCNHTAQVRAEMTITWPASIVMSAPDAETMTKLTCCDASKEAHDGAWAFGHEYRVIE